MIRKLKDKIEEIFSKKESFDIKFRTELAPWLTGRNVSSIGSRDRPEVNLMVETVGMIGAHFSNTLVITNSANHVARISEDILSVSNSTFVDNSVFDIENMNLGTESAQTK